jgi:hypothetical protein
MFDFLQWVNVTSIIAIILLIYIIYHGNNKASLYTKLLNGFYEADSGFCEESGISIFAFYLADESDVDGNKAAYILVERDGVLLINEPVVAKVSLKWSMWSNLMDTVSSPKYFSIEFKDLSPECIEVFPRHQTIRFYPTIGKIVLFVNNTITAVLYKNPINTELKSIVNENEKIHEDDAINGGDDCDDDVYDV